MEIASGILTPGLLNMDSVLSGYTVIDLSRDMAGAYTSMLLGDMGATVIKVEAGEGRGWRGDARFHHWNRGKKSVALDLSVEGARGALEAIVKSGDVVVEDCLAREAREKGLDYETLSGLNPLLVYCAIPPFGEEGPMADRPGNDGVVSAYSALMGNQNGADMAPEYITVPGPSCGAAFIAAYSIVSALYVREMEGVGQKVEAPLLNGSIVMQGSSFFRGDGMEGDPDGDSRDPRGVKAAYRLYQCSDGKWIFIACGNDAFWGKLCIAMGMEEFTANPRFQDAPWHFEPEDELTIKAFLHEKIGEETQAYWLKHFDEHDVPAAPADHRDEFLVDPQVQSDGILMQIDDPMLGVTTQLGPLVSVAGLEGAVSGPAPGLGEHGVEVLSGLGFGEEECSKLVASGALIC